MKNTKRIIAAVLTVIMMISMLPSNAFATEQAGNDAADSAVEAVSVPGEEQEIESTMKIVSEDTSETAEAEQDSSEEVQTVENAEPAAAEETEQTAEIPVEGTVLYPETDLEGKAGHVTVKVHAPEGALPKGTELKVEEVKKAEVEDLVNEATEETVSDFVAVDVSFHVNGQEEDFAPLKEVKVEFVLDKDALPETESYDVIHVAVDEKGKETPEVIEEEKIIDEITAEGGTISQKEFSVFIIAAKDTPSTSDGDDVKAVETWYFYTTDGDVNDEYTQAVKAGDELLKPPTPLVEDGQIFTGWYEKVNGAFKADPVSFGTVASVVSMAVHHVYPKVEDKVYVVFYDYDNNTIIETRAVASGGEVRIDDVKAQSSDTDNVFAGWAESANASLEDALAEDVINPDENIELYPVYTNGFRLDFDLNDDDGGGTSASYVAPQYLTATDKTERPDNPTRSGFTFVDWYTDTTLETPFTFGGTISENTTVYAKWEGGDSSYTVIVWQQKVTDDKGAADEEKTYDFVEASPEPIVAKTGSKVNAPSAYLQKNYPGFVLNTNNTDHDVVVKADGSTIVNVKYDRQLITWKFTGGIYRFPVGTEEATHYYYSDRYPSGYYFGDTGPERESHKHRDFPLAGYYNCGYIWTPIYILFVGGPGFVYRGPSGYYYYYYRNQTGYHEEGTEPDPDAPPTHIYVEDGIMTGLYGQELSKYGYAWPYGKWSYKNNNNGTTTLTFTETFMWLNAADPTNVNFNTTNETVSYTIYNYIEGTDGEFYMADEAYGYGSADDIVTFTFDKKYEGYTPTGYVLGAYISGTGETEGDDGSAAEPSTITKIKEKDTLRFTPSSNDNQLHIFHSRVSSTITFQKTDGTTIKTTDPIKYLEDISGYASEEAEAAPNYEFTGWYTDSTCYNEYDFNGKTMPANNLVVYAGFKLVSHDVTLDPNGGTFADETTESKTIKVTHEEAVPENELNGISREGYVLSGWTIGTAGGTTWDNADLVTENITLVANWTYTGSIEIEYYYDGEEVQVEDAHPYRDGANAKITHVLPDTEDYFKAWSENEDGSGELYYPGQIYTVDASKAVDGVIKLYAVCSEFELATTDIKFYTNQENATITDTLGNTASGDGFIEWSELPVNTAEIDLSEITGVHATKKLIGWAKDAGADEKFDADDVKFKVDDVVAADEAGNALYAVWGNGEYYIYHSASGRTETCEMPQDGLPRSIAGRVDTGYLYGGYYYYDPEDTVGEDEIDGDGDPVYRGKAYSAKEKADPGTALHPVMGTTYYLKEVSKEYLVPQVFIVWSKYQSSMLRQMHVMTDVDDGNYIDFGVTVDYGATVDTYDFEDKMHPDLAVTVVSNEGKETTKTYPISQPFNVAKGYIGVKDASKYIDNAYKNQSINLVAYFTTPDAVKVTGMVKRTIDLGNLTYNNWNPDGITQELDNNLKSTVNYIGSKRSKSSGLVNKGSYQIVSEDSKATFTINKIESGSKTEQKVEAGDNTGKITYTGKSGYVFAGWFTDSTYQKAADFSDVKANMTVYAKYVKDANVKLSFKKKSSGSGMVTLTSTLKVTGVSGMTDAAVDCTFNNNDFTVEISNEKETKSGSNVVKTYTGVVSISGLVNKSEFKAVISFRTLDGTVVNLDAKTCKYASGYITVK